MHREVARSLCRSIRRCPAGSPRSDELSGRASRGRGTPFLRGGDVERDCGGSWLPTWHREVAIAPRARKTAENESRGEPFYSVRGNTTGERTMNDFHHPCKHWAEAISMAAAGCLSSDEEREIRRHMETCSACREHFRQLTKVCGTLTELRLPTNGEDVVIVERVMSAMALSKPSQRVVRRSWGWAAVAAVAVSIVLAFTLRWTLFGPPNQPAVARNLTLSPALSRKHSLRPGPSYRDHRRCWPTNVPSRSDEMLERMLSQEADRVNLLSRHITPFSLMKMEPMP